MTNATVDIKYPFLAGGGEMGALTRAFDWTDTPLGAPTNWPQSLRSTVSLLLSSKFPMFLFWGPDLIQFYNDAYRPSLGNDGKHPLALGQRGEDCWTEIWPVIKPLIDQVMTQGEATWNEDQLIPIYRNGRLEDVYWTFSYSPVRDESGRANGVLVVCTETTEKVAMLRQVSEREEQLRFAINAAELATWDLNPVANRLTGNTRLNEWIGLAPGAEISLSYALSVMADTDRERVQHAIQEAIRPGSAGHYDISYTIVHPHTRQERVVRAKGKAHVNASGAAHRLNGTLQDITEEVAMRHALTRSNDEFTDSLRQFTFVTDFIPQIVWATRPDGTHDFYNRRWYDFTGLTVEESFGEGWATVLHPDDAPRTADVWQTCLRTGNPYAIEYRMRRRDGQYRWLLARAMPMRDESGQIIRWFGTCTDIHDQKAASTALEEQVLERTSALRTANYDLQRSNENLQRFAYVASHDLQEPLRKIQSFGDILKNNYGEQLGNGVDFLSRMQLAANRMSVLIKDLLAFSRITAQRDGFKPVALANVVQNVLTDLDMGIQESGAVVDVVPLPIVPGDSAQLGQLFQNLISNALKFRHPDKPLHVTISARPATLTELPYVLASVATSRPFHRITIADTGIGFDEKYLDRIFEVFQRLHTKSQYAGTGIGLAIVQKVVENHSGAITASSRPGEGATFTVYLPG